MSEIGLADHKKARGVLKGRITKKLNIINDCLDNENDRTIILRHWNEVVELYKEFKSVHSIFTKLLPPQDLNQNLQYYNEVKENILSVKKRLDSSDACGDQLSCISTIVSNFDTKTQDLLSKATILREENEIELAELLLKQKREALKVKRSYLY